MSAEKVILLLGRRDEPTDGVVDYCEKLREAGLSRGISFELVSISWAEKGWRNALTDLRNASAAWRDRWIFLQYTTLAWSRRGFPLRAPGLLEVLRQCGARPGVVFHDFLPLRSSGIAGTVREHCQLHILRKLYARAELAVFTVPLNKISWLPLHREKASFIPVGANCLEGKFAASVDSLKVPTVAVYSITGGKRAATEVADIGAAARLANGAVGAIRLLVFGRGARDAETILRTELAGALVEIESHGLLSPSEVSQALSGADVLLFVRGQISTRRGSAIAGIASGLPIVCYAGSETAWPITEAGIFAVPLGDREALAAALTTVLSDGPLRKNLAERSRQAHEKYFSWAAITGRFSEELHLRDKGPADNNRLETGAVART